MIKALIASDITLAKRIQVSNKAITIYKDSKLSYKEFKKFLKPLKKEFSKVKLLKNKIKVA